MRKNLIVFCRNFYSHKIRRTWFLDTVAFVPSNQEKFLRAGVFNLLRLLKHIKRFIYLFFNNQLKLEKNFIPNVKRILWINVSAPSIGDALMDLSGRVLFRNFELHLFGHSKYTSLFQNDTVFSKVFTSLDSARSEHSLLPYDFVILDSYSTRSVSIKIAICKNAPFATMYGFLNGFEVHRTIFSFYRAARLLSIPRPADELIRPTLHNRNFMCAQITDYNSINQGPTIAFAVGAEWEFRRYDHWPEVIKKLGTNFSIVLVGSSNGVADATRIISSCPWVVNYVGQCTLVETVQIIGRASMVAASDGGLWHVGCGLGKRWVGLFANCDLFDIQGDRVTRAPPGLSGVSLYADQCVSDIPPERVVAAIRKVLGGSDFAPMGSILSR